MFKRGDRIFSFGFEYIVDRIVGEVIHTTDGALIHISAARPAKTH